MRITVCYTWDANHNKTGESITGAMSGYGFTVPTAGYDDDDRLVAWERNDSNLDPSWDLSPVGDWDSTALTGRQYNPARKT